MNSPENETEFDPFENEPARKKSNGSSGGVAWLALIISLAAITFSGWQWWQTQSADPDQQRRQMAIDDLRSAQSEFSQSLDSLQGRLVTAEQRDSSGEFTALRSDISSIQARLAETGMDAAGDHALLESIQLTLSDLAQRVSDTETNVAALAVRSDTPGKRMDLAEVDYLLRLASERLTLFADARSADRALALAGEQLEALDDPLYLAVRRSIGDARRSLQDLPETDLVEVSGRIASLQGLIPNLPFPGEIPVEVLVEDQPDAGLWQRIKQSLAPLVKVRRRVNPDQELSFEDKDYLRQGLWLQLESARLALMRNDVTAWDLSLGGAQSAIENRFDSSAVVVRNALDGIVELRTIELASDLPDISAPLRQLRLLREGGQQGQSGKAKPVSEAEKLMEEIPDQVLPDEGEPVG